MADGGYTPRQIDKFTLADVTPLFDEWARLPTIRAMVAGYLGVKPKTAQSSEAVSSIAAIRAASPDGILR